MSEVQEKILSKKVFILNGTGGSGKNTFVNFIKKEHRTKHISIVDYVKEVAMKLGWDSKEKTEKDRIFLSELKIVLEEYNDSPYQSVKKEVETFQKDNITEFLFIDMRSDYDIERAVKEFDAITIFVENNNIDNITSNVADSVVRNDNYDYIIDNNGTLEELKETSLFFIEYINT
jgi:dephospho-CoA kinase